MKKRRIPLLILVLAILGFSYLLAPIVIVVLAGLNSGDFLSFPPKGLSLRWVIAFLQSEKYLSSFFFSFRLALMTMLISTILGTMAALYLSRQTRIWRGVLQSFFLSSRLARSGGWIFYLCFLHLNRIPTCKNNLGALGGAHSLLNSLCNWNCWCRSRCL